MRQHARSRYLLRTTLVCALGAFRSWRAHAVKARSLGWRTVIIVSSVPQNLQKCLPPKTLSLRSWMNASRLVHLLPSLERRRPSGAIRWTVLAAFLGVDRLRVWSAPPLKCCGLGGGMEAPALSLPPLHHGAVPSNVSWGRREGVVYERVLSGRDSTRKAYLFCLSCVCTRYDRRKFVMG